jgi:DHA1 family inner membrane transport protein
MQHRVVTLAGAGAPLASSLPASAVNAGIAVGSYAGGASIADAGVSAAVVTGIVLGVIAVTVAWATRNLKSAPDRGTTALIDPRVLSEEGSWSA